MNRFSRPGADVAALLPTISGAGAEAWARHAHRVSVWTRILLGLPLLIPSGWSRVWIGPWQIVALAAAVFFIRINPRMTPIPRSTNNWGSKSTLGERLWLRMTRDEVPPWHRTVPRVLIVGSALGHAVLLYGVVVLDPWPKLFGYATGMLCKLWYPYTETPDEKAANDTKHLRNKTHFGRESLGITFL